MIDARLGRAEKERRLSVVNDPYVRLGQGCHAGTLSRCGLHQDDVHLGAVLGSREDPPLAVIGKRIAGADPQVGAALELVLHRDGVEPGLLGGGNAPRA